MNKQMAEQMMMMMMMMMMTTKLRNCHCLPEHGGNDKNITRYSATVSNL